MKVYRIKASEFIYVRAIVFETDPFSIEMMPTFDITEAGWYPEDKATKYCEELNNNPKYQINGFNFTLEEVPYAYGDNNEENR